jgi:hypothetical protein
MNKYRVGSLYDIVYNRSETTTAMYKSYPLQLVILEKTRDAFGDDLESLEELFGDA